MWALPRPRGRPEGANRLVKSGPCERWGLDLQTMVCRARQSVNGLILVCSRSGRRRRPAGVASWLGRQGKACRARLGPVTGDQRPSERQLAAQMRPSLPRARCQVGGARGWSLNKQTGDHLVFSPLQTASHRSSRSASDQACPRIWPPRRPGLAASPPPAAALHAGEAWADCLLFAASRLDSATSRCWRAA